jgi:hypothetical protein
MKSGQSAGRRRKNSEKRVLCKIKDAEPLCLEPRRFLRFFLPYPFFQATDRGITSLVTKFLNHSPLFDLRRRRDRTVKPALRPDGIAWPGKGSGVKGGLLAGTGATRSALFGASMARTHPLRLDPPRGTLQPSETKKRISALGFQKTGVTRYA